MTLMAQYSMFTIPFEGKQYTARTIYYSGEEFDVATIGLQSQLEPFDTPEKVQLDETIAYYCSDEEMKLTDKEIYNLIYS